MDNVTPFIDNATATSRELLREVLNSGNDAQSMESMLKKCSEADIGFKYAVAYDSNYNITGFVWQTPAMQMNFHLFGDMIFLDSMKCKQNSIDWPYIGPVIVDGDDKMAVIAEAIMCSEQIEAYFWILDQILIMTPTQKRETINIIFSDGLISTSLLDRLNISETCHLVYDVHHLLGVGGDWERRFGGMWPTFKDYFKMLVYSNTKSEYENTFNHMKSMLGGRPDLLDYLELHVHSKHKHYM